MVRSERPCYVSTVLLQLTLVSSCLLYFSCDSIYTYYTRIISKPSDGKQWKLSDILSSIINRKVIIYFWVFIVFSSELNIWRATHPKKMSHSFFFLQYIKTIQIIAWYVLQCTCNFYYDTCMYLSDRVQVVLRRRHYHHRRIVLFRRPICHLIPNTMKVDLKTTAFMHRYLADMLKRNLNWQSHVFSY